MQFVLPFTKSRPQSGNLPLENNEDEVYETDQCSIDDDEDDIIATGQKENLPDPHPQADLLDSNNFSRTPSRTSSRSSTKRKAPPKPPADEMEHAVVNYLSQRSATQPENPDLDFFKSILPDVATLNASEKRRFKVIVLQALDNMLQEKKTSAPASTCVSNNNRQASDSSDVLGSNTAHMYNIHVGEFTPNPFGGSMLVNEGNYPPIYQPGCEASTPDQEEPSFTQ